MRRGLLVGSVVGLLNAGVAIALAWWFGRQPAEFGWYSYSPMPRRYSDYFVTRSTPGWQIALVVVTVFLVVNTAAVTGIFVLRRRRRSAQ